MPIRRAVKIFGVPAGSASSAQPAREPDIDVEALTEDSLREAVCAELERGGRRPRAVSFTRDGLVAYAEARS